MFLFLSVTAHSANVRLPTACRTDLSQELHQLYVNKLSEPAMSVSLYLSVEVVAPTQLYVIPKSSALEPNSIVPFKIINFSCSIRPPRRIVCNIFFRSPPKGRYEKYPR